MPTRMTRLFVMVCKRGALMTLIVRGKSFASNSPTGQTNATYKRDCVSLGHGICTGHGFNAESAGESRPTLLTRAGKNLAKAIAMAPPMDTPAMCAFSHPMDT